ncbi:glycosyltransferase, partial [Oscillatoriales cyanobacterium LEGE 11467]
ETPWLARKLAVALREKAREDVTAALEWYRRAIAEEPDNLEHYHRALELKPDDARLYLGLGDALTRRGNSAGAIAFYQMGLQLEPENEALHLGLGNCLLKKKRVLTPSHFSNNVGQYRIAIKTSVPNVEVAREWGDFHFANALKRAFEKRGHQVRVDCQDAWENPESDRDEVAIVLRGRHGYKPQPNCINLLWLISHPDRVSLAELNRFDTIFVASEPYTQKLTAQLQVPVSCLHQCTDPAVFYPETGDTQHDVLFVGNSRNVFRPIVRDALAGGIDVAVYGSRWEQFIPKSVIKGEYIPNDRLHQAYSNCQILLNDSWETMRDEGFLSNRLFDASACETFVISDRVAGLSEVFGEAIETHTTAEELHQKVNYYLKNISEQRKKARQAKEIVLANHTFDRRAKSILEVIDRLRSKATLQPKLPKNTLSLFYDKVENLNDKQEKLQPFLTEFAKSEAGLKVLTTPANPPLVSIIMPTFNRSYIIPEAIQSAIEQTYPNWELLICDDGSTDGTEDAIADFKDVRIRYFKRPKANGSVARNFGLKQAKGAYIAYLDSDNIWHPQHLQVCVNSLVSKTEFKCTYTWAIDSEFDDGRWDLKGTYCQPFNYDKLLERNYIDLNSFCHHRSVYEACGGFDESLLRLQDWDLVLRYLFAYSPKAIESFTVLYRRNLAWKQVTKLYEKTNMREIVRKKAIANLGRNFMAKKGILNL